MPQWGFVYLVFLFQFPAPSTVVLNKASKKKKKKRKEEKKYTPNRQINRTFASALSLLPKWFQTTPPPSIQLFICSCVISSTFYIIQIYIPKAIIVFETCLFFQPLIPFPETAPEEIIVNVYKVTVTWLHHDIFYNNERWVITFISNN